jgi:Tol biopolymer transport system component
MKIVAVAFALSAMLTVEQRDARRSHADNPSSAVSADGRFVAFVTFSQLAPADVNNTSDVYVLDRARQRVTLESTMAGPGTADCHHPAISGDGRYVVYARAGTILLRDRTTNVTTVVGPGDQPAITENGRTVLFTADTFDRVAGADANGTRNDVYAVDVASGQARRVSVELHGMDATAIASVSPSASANGRYVAFTSRLPYENGRSPEPHIFVRDIELNVTKRIGVGWQPSISGDGRYLVFAGLSERLTHVFLADLHTGTTRIITKSVRRGLANGSSTNPSISSDGRFVAFQSEASDLAAAEDFNLLWDVFVFDRTTGATSRISGDPNGVWMEPSSGPSIDARGSVIAFSSRHPTDASDKRNDFDLYVATVSSPSAVAYFDTEMRRN